MLTLTASAATWFLPFALPICIWVALNDMKHMKIPNTAVLALTVVFVVIGLFALETWSEYFWRYVHLIVVLVIGFVLNMIRAIGAGDAKFAAAMAPFVAFPDTGIFMILLAFSLIAALLLHRLARATPFVRRATPDWVSWTSKKFPMGTALGLSLATYLALGIANGS